jgi:hypothetical protein
MVFIFLVVALVGDAEDGAAAGMNTCCCVDGFGCGRF